MLFVALNQDLELCFGVGEQSTALQHKDCITIDSGRGDVSGTYGGCRCSIEAEEGRRGY